MNFAYNYINNYNDLKNLLINSTIDHRLEEDKEHKIMVDQIDDEHKTTNLFFFEDDEKPFCKIEHTEKGIHFFKRKDPNVHSQ